MARGTGAFPLGVASGECTHASAMLWTRYVGTRPLECAVFAESEATALAGGEPVFYGVVTPDSGGFVHLPVDGLEPGRRYAYLFREREGGSHAIAGRFRAADGPGTLRPLVFTASACARNGRTFGTLRGLDRDTDSDFHVLLGDTTYADGAFTVEEFRDKWAENLCREEFRALRASRGLVVSWDDHEVANDWAGDNLGTERIAAATKAFFEHAPLHRMTGAPNRLWRSHRFGDTAELFVLDVRSERIPESRLDRDGQYLSAAQFTWLTESLKASTARFKILVNSVPIGDFPGPFRPFTRDRWVGYPAQRQALLTFIEDHKLPGVFFLSGDFHMASLGSVSPTGAGRSIPEVLVGAVAARSRNPLTEACRPPRYSFASAAEHTARLRLDPLTGEVTVQWRAGPGLLLAERRFTV